MRPSLFIALLASNFAARAAWADDILTPTGERAVGLDARGVDPTQALENSLGVDVRDELGRPVTAAAVLSDMRKARAARTVSQSFFTRLPKAAQILPLLEDGAVNTEVVSIIGVLRSAFTPAVSPQRRPKILVPLMTPATQIQDASLACPASSRLPADYKFLSCRREILRC